jgi:hypothetical protein
MDFEMVMMMITTTMIKNQFKDGEKKTQRRKFQKRLVQIRRWWENFDLNNN